jgi:ubiquitin C-terminal hydrolase
MTSKKGFNNIGNTCYLNSGLQMLIQNRDFCQIILTNRNVSENVKTMADFIDEYYNSKENTLTPDKIKRMVEKKKPIFKGNQQQDAAEFIVALLEILNDDVKGALHEVIELVTNTRIKCKLKSCLNIINRTEKNPFLILPIKDDFNHLDDCYRAIKVHEKLEDDEKYFCENCKKKVIASKRLEVTEWSNHVIIWLKRFTNKNGVQAKNNKDIEIPQIWRHHFKIKGAVIHNGSLNGGHYFYISKNQETGVWTEYNDASTNVIGESRAQNLLNKAYILHYER